MPPKPSRLNLGIILLILGLGIICYGNTLNGPFLFDDYPNIIANSHLRIQSLAPAALADAAFRSHLPGRPIANISFALNYLLHGYWLPGYHLTNIMIHCLTGILLFLFIKGTFATPALRRLLPPEKALPVAAISTLLWLLNPTATQSVSYLVQRMNSLAAMFFLLSLLLYLKGRTAPKFRAGYFGGCLLSGLLALGSKEIAATLPPLLFLYEWYFFQDLDRGWLKRKLPLLGVAAVIIIFFGWLYLGRNFSIIFNGYHNRHFTLGERLMTEPRVVCRYLALTFFPYPGLLNLDHDYRHSIGLLQPPTTIMAMAALAALLSAAILLARRHRFFSFAILWFFVNLAIESSVIPLELIFDHRTYLPSMLLWPPLLAMAWRLPDRRRNIVLTAAIALLCLSAIWTYQRNQLWANEEALSRDIVRKSPNKARAHINLGMAIGRTARDREGERLREFKRAVALEPNSGYAYYYLGRYYLDNHLYDDAIHNLKMVTRLLTDYDKVYYYLSSAYYKKKQYHSAIAAARIAITVPAYREKALLILGLAGSETGDLETAISSFGELSRNYPNNGRYRFNLGRALEKNGQTELARQRYAEALAIAQESDKKVIRQAIAELRDLR
jgi:tetratricopeptide (TPR) repeat protein